MSPFWQKYVAFALVLGVSAALAAPVAVPRAVSINSLPLHPVIESKWLDSGREGLPVWFLPRLGVTAHREGNDLELNYAGRTLRFSGGHWSGNVAGAERLSPPEPYGWSRSLHVTLEALRLLGVPMTGTATTLNVQVRSPAPPALPASPAPAPQSALPAALVPLPASKTPRSPLSQSASSQSAPQPSPSVPLIGPRVTDVRSSLTPLRGVLSQRIVLDLSGPAQYSVQRLSGQLSVFLLGASAQPLTQKMESGDTLSLAPAVNAQGRPGVEVRLQTAGVLGAVQTLSNPDRLVIDSALDAKDGAPPPVQEEALPQGVSLRALGSLSLLSFDPARFTPRVVSAPLGSALSVAELVRRAGGVAGVNGGYFDPPSNLSVDFVTVSGQLLSSSLEKRAAVGFDARGNVLFGYPRPRYILEGNFGSLLVNAVSAKSSPQLLSAFVGDGRTAVGNAQLLTLLLPSLGAVTVQCAAFGAVVPPVGTLALSFDPTRFPQLPRTAGAPLNVRLDYQLSSWANVREGVAAGPLLLSGGKMVLDPAREAFNVSGSIWRPTRQVAFALYRGRPTIAFLESGTPETFAAALQRAGVSDALRLDSGSSATVYVAGGYLGTGGYLNTVWSRPVPNAIVLVPRSGPSTALRLSQSARHP